MAKHSLSRRNFLATLATTGAVATSQLSPLAGLASPPAVFNEPEIKRPFPDEPIKIICTMKFTQAEAAQIKAAGKNIELVMLTDIKDAKQIADAEVILGSLDGPLVLQAKKLKW